MNITEITSTKTQAAVRLRLAPYCRVSSDSADQLHSFAAQISAMERKSAAIANDTQKSQTALIEAVLETIQGMSIVKSFNLIGKGDKKLQDALEYIRRSNIKVSNILTPYTALQEAILQIAGVGMMLAAIMLCRGGEMSLANALMVLVM